MSPRLRWWSALALASALYGGCAVNGIVHPFRVLDDGRLAGPWNDPGDERGVIRHSETPLPGREDSYLISFDNAFFKDLPDLGGINEAVVIFRFNEGATGDEKDDIVKILGPMTGIADESYSSQISRICFGPKRMKSDVVSVRIQVVELDTGEMAGASAFVDFIGGIAQRFTLSDPVTAGEVKLAKEVADTIISLNQNDLVLDFGFDLMPYDENATLLAAGTKNRATLPLRAGHFGLIQQEQETSSGSYFFVTRHAWDNEGVFEIFSSIVSLPADLVMLPVVMLDRVFFELPSRDSLIPLTLDGKSCLGEGDKLIELEPTTRKLVVGGATSGPAGLGKRNDYQSKTWLTFTIEQGRDTTLSTLRDKMSTAEKALDEMMRIKSPKEVLERSKVFTAVDELRAVVKQEKLRRDEQGLFRRISPPEPFLYASDSMALTLLFERPAGTTVHARMVDAKSGAVVVDEKDKTIFEPAADSPSGTARFDLKFKAALAAGTYDLMLDHAAGGEASSVTWPLRLVVKPEIHGLADPLEWKATTEKSAANRIVFTIAEASRGTVAEFAKAVKLTLEEDGKAVERTIARDDPDVEFTDAEIRLWNLGKTTLKVKAASLQMNHDLADVTIVK